MTARHLAVGCLLLWAALARAQAVSVTVDGTTTHQTMQGFGATTLSLVFGPQDNVPNPTLRALANDAAFNQIKLNMGNLEVEPSEAPASNVYAPANDDDDPFTITAAGFNWVQSDSMFQKIVTPARPSGFTGFWLGPLVSTNFALGFVNPYKSSNPTRYADEVAEHVLAVVQHWKDAYGVDQPYVQLWNEPTTGNHELVNGTQADLVTLVKVCGARLRAAGFSTRFVVPAQETEDVSLGDATAILADPAARPYVGAIAYHPYPYGSTYAAVPNILASSGQGQPVTSRVNVRHQLRDLGAQYDVPVFMVEVSHSELGFTDFDNLRGRAIHIHDELEYANASAFFGMNLFWDTVSHAQHYEGRSDPGFWSETDTMVLLDVDAGTATISPMGRAVGHYARFITPGAVRLEATSSNPLVLVSAFRDPGQGRQVMVAINNDAASRTVNVSLAGLSAQGLVTGEQSTASAVWATVTPVALSSPTSFSLVLPAKSVTSVSVALAGTDGGPGPADAGAADAAVANDAGARDAAVGSDAGVATDAGTPDAAIGSDAGAATDAGRPDAAVGSDAGAMADAGPPDAAGNDAGTPDASVAKDAGAVWADGGTADGGTNDDLVGRCGCTSGGTLSPVLWFALWGLATRSSRRDRHGSRQRAPQGSPGR